MDTRVKLQSIDFEREFQLIEYPGVVKNDEKMLETLGGVGAISKVLSGEVKRLELKFHPDNAFAKPANGDSQTVAGLLLKIKIRKPKYDVKDQTAIPKVEVLGYCKNAIKFNSMCDYQYLPLLKNPETNKMTYIYDKIVPNGVPTDDWLTDHKQPYFIVPTLFSRNETIQRNIFRSDEEMDLDNDILGVVKARTQSKYYVTFSLTDPIPLKPKPIIIKKMKAKLVSDNQVDVIRKLFDECPIWNRVALMHESGFKIDRLKTILHYLSYYYVTGPWKTMYIRYGYDPRKHFESRYYQTFDYRIRSRSTLYNHVRNIKGIKQGLNKVLKKDDYARPSTSTEVVIQQDFKYPYLEEGCLPRGRQNFYRYCDLRLPKIKEMLDKIPTPQSGATCNEKTGWLPAGFEVECRSIVYNYLKQYVQPGVKDELADDDDNSSDDEEDEEGSDENFEMDSGDSIGDLA